jgi:co-chaperonin GroES (HSP10)
MKAIGRNLIIKKQKEGVAATKGGLLLAEKQREDIRYIKASVISPGEEANKAGLSRG